ncbi:MAG: hypothetical protein Q8O94_04480 [bacterium]|nr:hypothetical protein [bacterium]
MDDGNHHFYGNVHAELFSGIAERTARNLVIRTIGKPREEA